MNFIQFADKNGKRHSEIESVRPLEPSKEKEITNQEEVPLSVQREKPARDGDALSDISDDPDDILNQDDVSSLKLENQKILEP